MLIFYFETEYFHVPISLPDAEHQTTILKNVTTYKLTSKKHNNVEKSQNQKKRR